MFADRDRVLPVRHEGQLQLVRWGNQRGEDRRLPCTGWVWQSTVEAGQWSQGNAAPVTIPANFGLHNGIWYRILQGIRGLLVSDEQGRATVYMICEPSSHYYQVMTRSPWMPVLVGERI
jgi:hypothetical protein